MDELGDKLSAILNDPDSMERVRQMARAFWEERMAVRLRRILPSPPLPPMTI